MNHSICLEKLNIGGVPALIWGRESDKVYVHVHGKMSRKEYAEDFAVIAEQNGYQTLSFDLPEHGERANDHAYRCDIWNGPKDLCVMGDYAFSKWQVVNLYGCSLGAFFSLHAYAGRLFQRCLFQSPIVDMEYLVRKMMAEFGVTGAELREKGEIPNPIDTLRWDYYQFVKAKPITVWNIPTAILYGSEDWFQSEDVVRGFAQAHGCELTVAPGREHAFMGEGDGQLVQDWIRKMI